MDAIAAIAFSMTGAMAVGVRSVAEVERAIMVPRNAFRPPAHTAGSGGHHTVLDLLRKCS